MSKWLLYCLLFWRTDVSGKLLSMGYGFVIFTDKASADKAIKTLQHKDIDGHAVELKLSTKDTVYVTYEVTIISIFLLSPVEVPTDVP